MIDKKTKIKIGGQMQKVHIMTKDETLPVILFLHGGPGGVNRHDVMINHVDLLDSFTMVCWDQRGTGGSAKGTDYDKLCVDLVIEDTRELVERLCKMFNKDKIFILGLSWGSVLGTLFVQKYPGRVAAYVGYGQLVSGDLNEKLSYDWTLEQAKKAGNKEDIAVLEAIGRPEMGQYKGGLNDLHTERNLLNKYGGVSPNNTADKYMGNRDERMARSGEYSAADLKGILEGRPKCTARIWPEVCLMDFKKTVTKVEVPFYLFDGHLDMNTPWPLVEPWFDIIEAPDKCLVWFENSGHNPMTDEPEKFKNLLREKLGAIAKAAECRI